MDLTLLNRGTRSEQLPPDARHIAADARDARSVRDALRGLPFDVVVDWLMFMGQAVHITSDEVLTWDQVYRAIGKAAGVEPRIVHVPSDFISEIDPEARGLDLASR